MKTVFEHTQSRVLVIPQALYSMKDVTVLWQDRNSIIFHKHLDQDLRNIEFYTNAPCFIHIESGTEVLTNHRHDKLTLTPGTSIFLPQGRNLHSDFVMETKSLVAKLIFFDDEVLNEYLKKTGASAEDDTDHCYCILTDNYRFKHFFNSIEYNITDSTYLNTKLLELLHLIAFTDQQRIFHSQLSTTKRLPPQKNLRRLLETVDIVDLSVNDLAHLSGRSLSSFNRDFKALYQMTAKQWLLEKRLSKAKELLESEAYSVTDVALKVGYNNISHFIKAFKLKYGVTPKEACLSSRD
jgi:AraC family transcriptional regulator, exoenzyme S synthesis regulatory protein ExsA